MASVLLRGFVLGFVIAASPGPIFFLCLRRTLTRGALTGLVSGFGVATADGFYAALAAFGIGAVTSVLVGERRWLALIGGAVLVLLGLSTMLDRPTTAETTPSTIVSFAALVASMSLGISGGFLPPALFVLGVFAGSATWWCVLASFGAGLRARVTPRVVRGISTLSGLAIAGLGMLAVYSAFS